MAWLARSRGVAVHQAQIAGADDHLVDLVDLLGHSVAGNAQRGRRSEEGLLPPLHGIPPSRARLIPRAVAGPQAGGFAGVAHAPGVQRPQRPGIGNEFGLYPLAPDRVYVNFGFWGNVALPAGAADGYFNRQIEDKVTELDGHKGLYSTSFYSPDEFWRLYNGAAYAELKRSYDADGRLADLYEKCVRGK